MKATLQRLFIVLAFMAGINHLAAQGTAFTYQGRLNSSGASASGNFDFTFALFNNSQTGSQVGASETNLAIGVTNGLFTTTLDFGSVPWSGQLLWMQIQVRTNGNGAFTALLPRQPLTPTPYAIFADTASNVSGTVPAAQIGGTVLNSSLPGSPNFSGTVAATSFAGNGANVTGVNASQLNGLSATNFWQLKGNSGATAGLNFLGTTDNQPLELHVNNLRALRMEPAGPSSLLVGFGYGATNTGAPNVIGGSPVNFVAPGVVGAFIGGGGATNYESL
ncbi:MAG: hypothetical protein JWQ04_2152, partial [Pedosphaera sp.]|nr:hypothetical protein [Pedosphaera sp.]